MAIEPKGDPDLEGLDHVQPVGLVVAPIQLREPGLTPIRQKQAAVSTVLAERALGALHELLRGFDAAQPTLVRELARTRPDHLYEGLLTVLLRLVFVLYAEDRDLLPSRTDGCARQI